MRAVFLTFILALRDLARSRAELQVELIALRHQLSVLNRNRPTRVPLEPGDRLLWVLYSAIILNRAAHAAVSSRYS